MSLGDLGVLGSELKLSEDTNFLFRKTECPARQERFSGSFSTWITRGALTTFHPRLWVVEVVALALVLSKRCHPACP